MIPMAPSSTKAGAMCEPLQPCLSLIHILSLAASMQVSVTDAVNLSILLRSS